MPVVRLVVGFARRTLATFRSPIPDVRVPDIAYHQHVLRQCRRIPDTTALICASSGKRVTFGDLESGTRNVASGLAKLGFRHNDVMCIFSHNCVEYPIAMYGIMAAGGILTTANPDYTAYELASQLRDSGSMFLLSSKAKLKVAAEAAKASGVVQEIFVIDDLVEGFRSFADLLEDDGKSDPTGSFNFNQNDLAAILYSSGTTGLPKGVMLRHRNLVANIEQCLSYYRPEGEQRLLGMLPLFHVYGQVPILGSTLANGDSLTVMSSFEPVLFYETLQRHRLTIVHLVPPVVIFMLSYSQAHKYDLSSVSTVMSGAAPLGRETQLAFKIKYPHIDIVQGWGMTETSPVGALTPLKSSPLRKEKPGSAGLLLPNLEMRVVDPETRRDLGPNQTGEFLIRGDCVMAGYYNNQTATDECMTADGWFSTGDIGYIDEDNYMYVSDRLKELIKVKGLQVAPAELESLLLECPQVADAAVVGRPDERAGELPVAFVVAKSESETCEKSVYNWVAERAAPHKRLDGGIRFVKAIPKAASGKILRKNLKAMLDSEKQ